MNQDRLSTTKTINQNQFIHTFIEQRIVKNIDAVDKK